MEIAVGDGRVAGDQVNPRCSCQGELYRSDWRQSVPSFENRINIFGDITFSVHVAVRKFGTDRD